MIQTDDQWTINAYVPSFIEPKKGDVAIWEECLEYLFPNPQDRYEIIRWVVTLVARPDLKLFYGLLLVTEQTGIGKSFFGTVILGKLVGDHNYGEFSENQLLNSDFTDWYKNKKLT